MKQLLFACVMVVGVSRAGPAFAQTVDGFAGVGLGAADNQFHDYSRTLQATGGVDVVLWQGVAVTGDVGLAAGGGDAWVPTSINGTYRIMKMQSAEWLPYVSGGLTWLNWVTEHGHERDYNIGAGFILWGRGRTGFRVEFRDVIRRAESFTIGGVTREVFPTRHWWSVNIAAAFR
jgi:hypothetical protein